MAQPTACGFCRGLGFASQHQNDSQPSVALVPRDISSGFLRLYTHVVYRRTMQIKHSMYIEIKLILKKSYKSTIRSFSSSKKKMHTHEFTVHHPGLSLASDNPQLLSADFPILAFCRNRLLAYMAVCNEVLSLRIMFLSPVHSIECSNISLAFTNTYFTHTPTVCLSIRQLMDTTQLCVPVGDTGNLT